MSKKIGSELLSRRAMLRSAVSVGAAVLAAPALAQSTLDGIMTAPRRGNWDDQFDARGSRSAVGVVSNNPILGSEGPDC